MAVHRGYKGSVTGILHADGKTGRRILQDTADADCVTAAERHQMGADGDDA